MGIGVQKVATNQAKQANKAKNTKTGPVVAKTPKANLNRQPKPHSCLNPQKSPTATPTNPASMASKENQATTSVFGFQMAERPGCA